MTPDLFDERLAYGGFLGIAALAAVVVGHCAAGVDSSLTRMLTWAPLVWLGKRSYGVYLYHYAIGITAVEITGVHWLQSPVGLLAGTALAALSFRHLEEPMRRRGSARRAAAPGASPALPHPAA